MTERIDATALGVPRRGEELLVQELDVGERFFRPIGGGVEFGESGAEAVVREFREELDVAVSVGSSLGTIENRFELGGRHHEIVLLYEAAFDDDRIYERSSMTGHERDSDVTYETAWRTLPSLCADEAPLYPDGVERILRGEARHVTSSW